MPSGRANLRCRYSRIDLSRGEDANDGGEIGRAAALAGPLRLFFWRNWPLGGRIDHSKQYNEVPFGESRLRNVPGGGSHPGATQTSGVEIIERRCCLSGVALVFFPPASTSRADKSNVGEEIGRSATSIAPPLRCSPADVVEQAERNRQPHNKSEKPPVLGRRPCYPPGGVDHARGQDPSRTKNLHGRQLGIVA